MVVYISTDQFMERIRLWFHCVFCSSDGDGQRNAGSGKGRWSNQLSEDPLYYIAYAQYTVIILLLLSIGGILHGNFDLFYNIVGSNNVMLQQSTDVLETFIFRAMVSNSNFSTAAAVSFVQSVFGLVVVLLTNTIVKKVEPDYALF